MRFCILTLKKKVQIFGTYLLFTILIFTFKNELYFQIFTIKKDFQVLWKICYLDVFALSKNISQNLKILFESKKKIWKNSGCSRFLGHTSISQFWFLTFKLNFYFQLLLSKRNLGFCEKLANWTFFRLHFTILILTFKLNFYFQLLLSKRNLGFCEKLANWTFFRLHFTILILTFKLNFYFQLLLLI